MKVKYSLQDFLKIIGNALSFNVFITIKEKMNESN